MVSYPDTPLTAGVRLDGKTFAGDLVGAATAVGQRRPLPPIVVDTRSGVYVPRWGSGKDDTIFVCPDDVDFNSLRDHLYKTDFGYTFSERNPSPWTAVPGDRWLTGWNEPDGTTTGDDATTVKTTSSSSLPSSPLVASCRAVVGCRERLNRSIVILPVDEAVRLNGGGGSYAEGRRLALKKIGRAHGRTVYALAERGSSDARDVGYVITTRESERSRPPALNVVRDADARVFCLVIGDYATERFADIAKEDVHRLFSHYEGRIATAPFAARGDSVRGRR